MASTEAVDGFSRVARDAFKEAARVAHGATNLSYRKLAKLTGIHEATVSRTLAGVTVPGNFALMAMAKAWKLDARDQDSLARLRNAAAEEARLERLRRRATSTPFNVTPPPLKDLPFEHAASNADWSRWAESEPLSNAERPHTMKAISVAHLRLGQELRRIRRASGVTTRGVRKHPLSRQYFSTGHISLVESGRAVPSPELIEAYERMADDRVTLRALYAHMLAASISAGRLRRGVPPPERVGLYTPSPEEINSKNDFAAALMRLRFSVGEPSWTEMASRARNSDLVSMSGWRITRSGLWYAGQPNRSTIKPAVVEAFLVACGVTDRAITDYWQSLLYRATDLDKRKAAQAALATAPFIQPIDPIAEPIDPVNRPMQHKLQYNLSRAEFETLRYLAEGFDVIRIARARSVSKRTVEKQLGQVYAKLHVHSAAEAVTKAYKERLFA